MPLIEFNGQRHAVKWLTDPSTAEDGASLSIIECDGCVPTKDPARTALSHRGWVTLEDHSAFENPSRVTGDFLQLFALNCLPSTNVQLSCRPRWQ